MHTRRIGLGNKSLLPSDPYASAYLTAGCLVISLILTSEKALDKKSEIPGQEQGQC